ncbi:MAG: hypothetical protein U0457_09060 [Candidatus Sericytochromatia bacterium]
MKQLRDASFNFPSEGKVFAKVVVPTNGITRGVNTDTKGFVIEASRLKDIKTEEELVNRLRLDFGADAINASDFKLSDVRISLTKVYPDEISVAYSREFGGVRDIDIYNYPYSGSGKLTPKGEFPIDEYDVNKANTIATAEKTELSFEEFRNTPIEDVKLPNRLRDVGFANNEVSDLQKVIDKLPTKELKDKVNNEITNLLKDNTVSPETIKERILKIKEEVKNFDFKTNVPEEINTILNNPKLQDDLKNIDGAIAKKQKSLVKLNDELKTALPEKVEELKAKITKLEAEINDLTKVETHFNNTFSPKITQNLGEITAPLKLENRIAGINKLPDGELKTFLNNEIQAILNNDKLTPTRKNELIDVINKETEAFSTRQVKYQAELDELKAKFPPEKVASEIKQTEGEIKQLKELIEKNGATPDTEATLKALEKKLDGSKKIKRELDSYEKTIKTTDEVRLRDIVDSTKKSFGPPYTDPVAKKVNDLLESNPELKKVFKSPEDVNIAIRKFPSELKPEELGALKQLREAFHVVPAEGITVAKVSFPGENSTLQKFVIDPELLKTVKTPEELVDALKLDYEKSPFVKNGKPTFKLEDIQVTVGKVYPDEVKIPFSTDFVEGGRNTVIYQYPFSGNGFTTPNDGFPKPEIDLKAPINDSEVKVVKWNEFVETDSKVLAPDRVNPKAPEIKINAPEAKVNPETINETNIKPKNQEIKPKEPDGKIPTETNLESNIKPDNNNIKLEDDFNTEANLENPTEANNLDANDNSTNNVHSGKESKPNQGVKPKEPDIKPETPEVKPKVNVPEGAITDLETKLKNIPDLGEDGIAAIKKLAESPDFKANPKALDNIINAFDKAASDKTSVDILKKFLKDADPKILAEKFNNPATAEEALGLIKKLKPFFEKFGVPIAEAASKIAKGLSKALPVLGAAASGYDTIRLGKIALTGKAPDGTDFTKYPDGDPRNTPENLAKLKDLRALALFASAANGVDTVLGILEATGVGNVDFPIQLGLAGVEIALDFAIDYFREHPEKMSPEITALIKGAGIATSPIFAPALLEIYGADGMIDNVSAVTKTVGEATIGAVDAVGTAHAEVVDTTLKSVASDLNTLADVIRHPEKYATQLGKKVDEVVSEAVDLIKEFASGAGKVANKAADLLVDIASNPKKYTQIVANKALDVGKAIFKGTAMAADFAKDLITKGLMSAEQGVKYLGTAGIKFLKDGISLAGELGNKFRALATDFYNNPAKYGKLATDFMTNMKDSIINGSEKAFNFVSGLASKGISTAKQAVTDSLEALANAEKLTVDYAKYIATHPLEASQKLLQATKNTLINAAKAGQEVLNYLSDLQSRVGGALGRFEDTLVDLAKQGGTVIKEIVSKHLNVIKNRLPEILSAGANVASAVGEQLAKVLPTDKLVSLLSASKAGFATLMNLTSKYANIASQFMANVKAEFSNAWNKGTSSLVAAIEKYYDMAVEFGGAVLAKAKSMLYNVIKDIDNNIAGGWAIPDWTYSKLKP